jgi:hypothetical protein
MLCQQHISGIRQVFPFFFIHQSSILSSTSRPPRLATASIHQIEQLCRLMPSQNSAEQPTKSSLHSTKGTTFANAVIQKGKQKGGSQTPYVKKPFPWQKTDMIGIKRLTKEILQMELGITEGVAWEQLDLQVLTLAPVLSV